MAMQSPYAMEIPNTASGFMTDPKAAGMSALELPLLLSRTRG